MILEAIKELFSRPEGTQLELKKDQFRTEPKLVDKTIHALVRQLPKDAQ
jgi:hypothetical protein